MDAQAQHGLMSTYRQAWRRRDASAWALSALLIAIYLDLYFRDDFDAPARALGLPDRWYLYGALYSLVMVAGAARYLRDHGNSRYNRIRIAVNVGIQLVFGWSLPFAMHLFGQREYYFSYLWPLKIEYFDPAVILQYPGLIVIYSFAAALLCAPLLAVLIGKRWYCSWVCGCGALANTFGDPWRHLSSKSARAHRLELVTVYTVLVLALLCTALVAANWAIGAAHPGLSQAAFALQKYYGLIIGAILSGVVGVGLYPLLGPRVWCRFFCPMAALLGLLQKAGRFHIRVKPDMCIACGNCSAYCEMGIDVRAYAMRDESFTRASCVGCGACAHVCPRGVLKLEAAPLRAGSAGSPRLPIV